MHCNKNFCEDLYKLIKKKNWTELSLYENTLRKSGGTWVCEFSGKTFITSSWANISAIYSYNFINDIEQYITNSPAPADEKQLEEIYNELLIFLETLPLMEIIKFTISSPKSSYVQIRDRDTTFNQSRSTLWSKSILKSFQSKVNWIKSFRWRQKNHTVICWQCWK